MNTGGGVGGIRVKTAAQHPTDFSMTFEPSTHEPPPGRDNKVPLKPPADIMGSVLPTPDLSPGTLNQEILLIRIVIARTGPGGVADNGGLFENTGLIRVGRHLIYPL